MNDKLKGLLRPLIFTASGAVLGYLYYRFVGCSSGSCVIASNPVNSMIYMGLIGFLFSGALKGGCCCGSSCRIDDPEDDRKNRDM